MPCLPPRGDAATGDWILFTDADCWLKPDVLVRALRVAERERADHVTRAAGTNIGNVGVRACLLTMDWRERLLASGRTGLAGRHRGSELVEAEMQRYAASLRGCKKNEFPVLQPQLQARINFDWRSSFEEWGYCKDETVLSRNQ